MWSRCSKPAQLAARRLGALALIFCVVSGTVAADEGDPPGRVARLSDTEGSVSLQPAGVQDWAAATLTIGDRTAAPMSNSAREFWSLHRAGASAADQPPAVRRGCLHASAGIGTYAGQLPGGGPAAVPPRVTAPPPPPPVRPQAPPPRQQSSPRDCAPHADREETSPLIR